jgi:ribonuclease HI
LLGSGVDAADLLSRLRRLSHATPGDGVLQLPRDLPSPEAVQTILAALEALESRPASRRKPAKPGGSIRIHIDGAARGNPGPAGVGVVIVGADGEVVERLHHGIGEATNNVAEYRALLLALERALALGYTDLEVYSDSELMVRQLQGRYQVKHPRLRELFAVAKDRIASLRRFGIRHVPRDQNAEADALANRAIDEARRPGRRGVKSDPGSHGTGGVG